ncbi:hypothetical protein [Peribacillus kribbensis]|uniref:hypothetical protein n=1 Tax=Peribacillus kribbensis TaxID=356658 RepID=UPI000424A6AD|nr:hypothetical protein [Peribacillus kribbensis]
MKNRRSRLKKAIEKTVDFQRDSLRAQREFLRQSLASQREFIRQSIEDQKAFLDDLRCLRR